MKRVVVCLIGLALLALQACSSPPPAPKNPANPVVLLDTSMGKIYVEIFEDKSPITAKNFMRYVDEKHYDGTIFHRVIPNFMIQGGGFPRGMRDEKPTHESIKNEAVESGLLNKRGTIAMARTPDPDSATAQFFISVKDNPDLDPNEKNPAGYAVFGEVLEGMDVVDDIKKVRTRTLGRHDDVPEYDVVITSARRVEAKK